MPYADVDGLRLYYEQAGRGDPELLFVPGWCCDHTAFQPQLDHFSKTHAVTALDLRGCGRSDRPRYRGGEDGGQYDRQGAGAAMHGGQSLMRPRRF